MPGFQIIGTGPVCGPYQINMLKYHFYDLNQVIKD